MERLLDSPAVRNHVAPNTTELNEEALMLLTAGNDTTANAIIFGVYYICRHPDVQQKLAAELRAQFPGTEQKITYEDLRNLPYLVREPPSSSKTPHNPGIRTSHSLYVEPEHAPRDLKLFRPQRSKRSSAAPIRFPAACPASCLPKAINCTTPIYHQG